MRRREFITLLAGSVVACPLAAQAQGALPVIGYLDSRSADSAAPFSAEFKKSLKEAGFTDGKTARFEYRFANDQLDRLPSLAAELIALRPTVIAAAGGSDAALAAKHATSSIPIVFVNGADPVRLGLVDALNRPGGNVTGVSFLGTAIIAKRLDLLRATIPNATKVAILVNPNNPAAESMASEVAIAEHALGLKLLIHKAETESEIGTSFADIAQEHADALLIGGDRFFNAWREKLVALSARYALPSMFDDPEFAADGGLMSYGASQTDAYRQAGDYVGRILKGEKPSDLPVLLSSKFELLINMKTARALHLKIPSTLLAIADDVIE
jgi:putative ABC transport system substrate-binding protein